MRALWLVLLVGRAVAAPLTAADALTLADGSAPAVILSTARAATARADVAVAGMFQNPRVTVGTTTSSAVVFASLYVALPLFGTRRAAMDVADAQARVATAGVELARLDARFAVADAWIGLWQAQEELRIAEDNAKRRDRIVEIAKARFTEGAAPRLETLRAETEAKKMHGEVSALADLVTAAAARLGGLINRDTPSTLGEPPALDHLPSLSELEAGLGDHPLARRAQAMLRASDATVVRERRERWPVLGLQIGGSFLDRAPPPTNDVNFALSADLPLFNGVLVARAVSARDAARTESSTVMIALKAENAGARADYLAAERRRAAQLDDVLPSATEVAELSSEAYREGGLDLTGALAAEQALSDAKLAAMRAVADRGRSLAALEHASGRHF